MLQEKDAMFEVTRTMRKRQCSLASPIILNEDLLNNNCWCSCGKLDKYGMVIKHRFISDCPERKKENMEKSKSLHNKKQKTIKYAGLMLKGVYVWQLQCVASCFLPVWASRRTDWGGNNERRVPELHSCHRKRLGPGKLTPRNRSMDKERTVRNLLSLSINKPLICVTTF